jgi:hypothetical protein
MICTTTTWTLNMDPGDFMDEEDLYDDDQYNERLDD